MSKQSRKKAGSGLDDTAKRFKKVARKVKRWYRSKLVWLGAVMTLSGALPLVFDLVKKAQATTEMWSSC